MISTSNSNWLDKLRSSRGFPTGNEPDLDRFLSSSSSSGSAPTPNESATHSESTQSHPPIPTRSSHLPPSRPPTKEFNGILGDLFNMGGENSRKFSIKTSRKQPNPRFCKLSSNSNTESLPGSSGDNRQKEPCIVSPKWGLGKVGNTQLYPCNKEIVSSRNKNGDDVILRVDEELKGGGDRGDGNIIPLKWGLGKVGSMQLYPCNREIVSSRNKNGDDVIIRVDEELRGGNGGDDNKISQKWGLGKVGSTQLYPRNKEIVSSRSKSGNDVVTRVDEELRGGNRGDDNIISLKWDSEKVGSVLPYHCNRENVSRDNKNGNDVIVRVDDEKDELKGYTRNEVTIVDTSLKDWKCDKWVLRKNDEWKIKDKKSKSRGGSCGVGKKRKVLVSKLEDGNSSKINDGNGNGNGDGLDCDHDQVMLKMINKKKMKREIKNLLMYQNKEKPQNDKEGELCKENEDFLSKFSRKRFPCPRPPEKVRNEGSSVVLLKSIPPSNVNTPIKPVKTFHKKRPTKQMKIV